MWRKPRRNSRLARGGRLGETAIARLVEAPSRQRAYAVVALVFTREKLIRARCP